MIAVTPAERWEAEWLSSRLRAEDCDEVITATGRSPLEVVPLSFDCSTQCYAIRYATPSQVDEFPCSIFGVADDPEVEGLGVVWLLGTDDIRKARLAILKATPHYLNLMSRDYPHGLHNLVDHRNALHLFWCARNGLQEIGQVTVNGHPFHHVHRPQPKEYASV